MAQKIVYTLTVYVTVPWDVDHEDPPVTTADRRKVEQDVIRAIERGRVLGYDARADAEVIDDVIFDVVTHHAGSTHPHGPHDHVTPDPHKVDCPICVDVLERYGVIERQS